MQVGSDIPVPTVSFDGSVIESVTIDTSAVDKDTVGTYPITYVITGLDGSVENVEKECRVVEDAALEDLRDEMCARLMHLAKISSQSLNSSPNGNAKQRLQKQKSEP